MTSPDISCVTVRNRAEIPEDYRLDDKGRFVFGVVIQTRRDQGVWGYRMDEETAGPEFARAPKSLIDLLSPTSSVSANKWRRRCIENSARRSWKLSDGDVIRLDQTLECNDGRKRRHFKVIIENPRDIPDPERSCSALRRV